LKIENSIFNFKVLIFVPKRKINFCRDNSKKPFDSIRSLRASSFDFARTFVKISKKEFNKGEGS